MHRMVREAKGFTFIEFLISMGVLAILVTLMLASFSKARQVRDLSASTQTVLSVLRLAQSKTLAGENDSAWGVHLESNKITLFQGDTFSSAPFTQIYDLPLSIELVAIALNGGSIDVIFKRVTGDTDQHGSFILRVAADPANSRSFAVDGSGKIYAIGAFSALTGTRIIDVRHRAFTLGWSIKTATTMTLTFADPPNPDTVQNISMSLFFDGGKTKFDWSGTISIGNIPQQLRIHTTSLTDTDTVLSVDRDCRTNSKRLTIVIDGKTIAAYEADCKTLTVGSFGGTVAEP